MIHAYNEEMLHIFQKKVAEIFELAVLSEKVSIKDFCKLFRNSIICNEIQEGNISRFLSHSSNEILGEILNKKAANNIYLKPKSSKYYWYGWTITYIQWYFNTTFEELFKQNNNNNVLNKYCNSYSEETLQKIIKYYFEHLHIENALKKYRIKMGYSQKELSILTGISLRAIQSYEQNQVDLSKAQGDTLYIFAKTLNCTIEDLIK